MSSSDSDDDCYGNAAKTLESLKNEYHEDKLDSAKFLNNSQDSNNVNKNTNKATAVDNTLSDDEEIDKLIALNSKRRSTRSSRLSRKETNLSGSDTSETNTSSRGRVRRSKRLSYQISNASPTVLELPRRPSNQGRNTRGDCGSRGSRGGRGRRGRYSRGSHNSTVIFSVGNCEDYEDLSNNVELFTKSNNTNDVQVIEDDIFDENEEMSVKVIWQSVDIVKFTIRKYQKIAQIYEYFSNKTNVSIDKLLFTFNDKFLTPEDTPDTINYNIAKFIDGGIVSNNVSHMKKPKLITKPQDGIQIKFQYPNSKRAFEIYVTHDELLSISMMKCAEHMELPLKRLKFEFDGDSITGQMTARELEMEGGECIDVKIINS